MNSYVNTTTLQSINRANGKHEGDLQACCGALISITAARFFLKGGPYSRLTALGVAVFGLSNLFM